MNHLSLFSGIGGIDLAAQWAGMITVAFVERDPFCQKVLAKHWPGVPCFGDIHDVTAESIRQLGRIDILTGGFPCQPFSLAGKQAGTSDDRYLWPEMLRVIKIAQPTWVVGENVPGIIHMALDDVLSALETEGYEARTLVLPACAVGAWHARSRVFIVAYHESKSAQRVTERTSSVGIKCETWEKFNPVSCPSNIEPVVEHADSERLKERDVTTFSKKQGQHRWSATPNGASWLSEPSVGRVANGIPRRMDRLRALGNAVVPQQIYQILKLIMEQNSGN